MTPRHVFAWSVLWACQLGTTSAAVQPPGAGDPPPKTAEPPASPDRPADPRPPRVRPR